MKAPLPDAAPSLIETMRLEPGGNLPLLEGHLKRLEGSCAALAYRWPGTAFLRERIGRAASSLDAAQHWRLRLLLGPDGHVSMETGPLPLLPDPLRVVVRGPRMEGARDWLLHKTTHRPWYEDAAGWLAAHPGVFDILYWDSDGWMNEGSRSNLYMQTSDGRWLTPPLEAGVLPGVQRQALLDRAQVQIAPIHRDDFLRAKAWRISNALRGWRDVMLEEIQAKG